MKSLAGGVQTALDSDELRVVLFCELGLSTVQRLCSAAHDVTWNGYTWVGVGALSFVEPVEEVSTLEAVGYKIGLSGVPSSQIAVALGEPMQNKSCKLWFAVLDNAYQMVGSPTLEIDAYIDGPIIEDAPNKDSRITLTVENALADASRPRVKRFTDADHQATYPGDKFFEFVASMVDQ